MTRVGITTYNRNAMCAALVDALAGPDVDIHVYDDGSDTPFEHPAATVHRYEENGGATFWFMRVTDLLQNAFVDNSWDYLFWSSDDLMLMFPNVLDRLRRKFEAVLYEDPEVVCINPLKLRHHPSMSWTGFEPVDRHGLWQTQWMDCCGFVDRRFVQAAVQQVRQCSPRWSWTDNDRGTGVGKAASLACHSLGYSMYQTKETWFSHGDHPSALMPYADKSFAVTP